MQAWYPKGYPTYARAWALSCVCRCSVFLRNPSHTGCCPTSLRRALFAVRVESPVLSMCECCQHHRVRLWRWSWPSSCCPVLRGLCLGFLRGASRSVPARCLRIMVGYIRSPPSGARWVRPLLLGRCGFKIPISSVYTRSRICRSETSQGVLVRVRVMIADRRSDSLRALLDDDRVALG